VREGTGLTAKEDGPHLPPVMVNVTDAISLDGNRDLRFVSPQPRPNAAPRSALSPVEDPMSDDFNSGPFGAARAAG
jgi:hypothetical protein